jgi:hypothetical protein
MPRHLVPDAVPGAVRSNPLVCSAMSKARLPRVLRQDDRFRAICRGLLTSLISLTILERSIRTTASFMPNDGGILLAQADVST